MVLSIRFRLYHPALIFAINRQIALLPDRLLFGRAYRQFARSRYRVDRFPECFWAGWLKSSCLRRLPRKWKIHRGSARPDSRDSQQRRFRTRIREGVENGWGVWTDGEWGAEHNRLGPNFAGHYIVIVWGCGAPCLMMAVADAETGAVYSPPLSARLRGLTLPLLAPANSAPSDATIEYRLNSKLMIVKATPNADRPSAVSYAFYFVWEGDRWKLLRRIPILEDE